jgi:hypothetical protein
MQGLCLAGPFLLYGYVLIAGFFVTSQSPVVLGRYSTFLAAFNVVGLIVYGLALIGIATQRWRFLSFSCLALILLTYCAPANNAMQSVPFIIVVLPLTRLCAGMTIVLIEFNQFRLHRESTSPSLLMVGAVCFAIAAADITIAAIKRSTPPHAIALTTQFRDAAIDVNDLVPGSIAIVGDSFAWGLGVTEEEAFSAVLEQMLTHEVPRTVYSLGIVGAGPRQYVDVLSAVPETTELSRVVLSYYMNDMPGRERFSDRIRNICISLGTGAPTLRLLGDSLARTMTPTVDEYLTTVIADYQPDEASFPRRWAELEGYLRSFAELADKRSSNPPILLVLPIMVDFDAYPLSEAHDDLRSLGADLGYDVLDLLPAFRRELVDGSRYRVAQNDNHFNAEVHALVARELARKLGTTQKPPQREQLGDGGTSAGSKSLAPAVDPVSVEMGIE